LADADKKRGSIRIPVAVTEVKICDEKKCFLGYARNVSLTGIFVQADTPKDVGEECDVEFIIPTTNRDVHVRCRVIWNRMFSEAGDYEPGMGLRFEDLDPDAEREIEAWIFSQ